MDKFSFIYNLVKSKMDSWGGIYPSFEEQLYERAFNVFFSIIRDGIQKISV